MLQGQLENWYTRQKSDEKKMFKLLWFKGVTSKVPPAFSQWEQEQRIPASLFSL